MAVSELAKRMPEWVGKVPYSHRVNSSWGYPTDCSGFISWAIEARGDIKAYEWASDKYSTRIETGQLRYGDIITHVWDHLPLQHRCTKQKGKKQASLDRIETKLESEMSRARDAGDTLGVNPLDYLWGHVMFFDKWVNSTQEEFWAYESSQTEDQTPACLAHKGPCLNHHVIKKRKSIDKWSHDNCTTHEYGRVTGGARRLQPALLCPPVAPGGSS